jgi:excisionase family DNA binding protein
MEVAMSATQKRLRNLAGQRSISTATFSSAEELAHHLNLSKPSVLRGLANGSIPGRKVGSRWIVSRDVIKEWLHGQASGERP